MKFYDFQYDRLNLSDMGYMICCFGTKGLETISNGSQIVFNTVSTLNGAKHELLSSQYNECLTSTFQICKNPCYDKNLEISMSDFLDLTSWLSRKEFHKFKLLKDDYLDLFFEASFNINRIEINGKLYGLELNMVTNRPFALQENNKITIKTTVANSQRSFNDTSNEEGVIYPSPMKITMLASGNLSITNKLDNNRVMVIKNVIEGEVITLNYPMISSSISSHKIQNDFNWKFFRIANTFKNKKNDLIISLPCNIEIIYNPIIKIGF